MTSYHSVFAPHIGAMLELRDSLGLYTDRLTFVMQSFDRFCLANHFDTNTLTRELATQWCDEGKSAGRSAYKMHAIRLFGKYLQSVEVNAFVMPSGWIGKRARRLPCRSPNFLAHFRHIICPPDREAVTASKPFDLHRWASGCPARVHGR